MTETENVWNDKPGETTVTIKYGKGYEEPWAVFRGTPAAIRAQLIAYFEPEPETIEGLTLHELVVNLTNLAHAVSTAATGLGGTVVSTGRGGGWAKAAGGGTPAEPAAPAEPERNPLYGTIEAATTVAEVKEIFARNPAIKDDPELLAAWKAKGKSLAGTA